MSLDQAPSAVEKPLAQQIEEIDQQIEEAHLTFDTDRASNLQQQKLQLEAQAASAPSPVSGVAEIIKTGDPVAIAELDTRYAIVPNEEDLTGEPIQDEHVKEKMRHTLDNLIPRRASDFVDIFFEGLDVGVDGSQEEARDRIIGNLAKRNLDGNLFLTKDGVEKYVKASILGSSEEEFKKEYYSRLKEQVVSHNGFDSEIADLLLSSYNGGDKKEKLVELMRRAYPDVYKNIGDPRRSKELRDAIASHKQR